MLTQHASMWMEMPLLPEGVAVLPDHKRSPATDMVSKQCLGLGSRAWRQAELRLLQTRDLGALMELVACNAKSIEGGRGALGVLNWLGNAALRLAHMAR